VGNLACTAVKTSNLLGRGTAMQVLLPGCMLSPIMLLLLLRTHLFVWVRGGVSERLTGFSGLSLPSLTTCTETEGTDVLGPLTDGVQSDEFQAVLVEAGELFTKKECTQEEYYVSSRICHTWIPHVTLSLFLWQTLFTTYSRWLTGKVTGKLFEIPPNRFSALNFPNQRRTTLGVKNGFKGNDLSVCSLLTN
jgi:hypothetical protein